MRFCSKVVVPEENRSYIAEVLYNLDRRPFILPNKPYNFDNKELQVLSHIDKYISRIKDLKNDGRVLLVYQGYISDLRDLCQICRVVEKYKENASREEYEEAAVEISKEIIEMGKEVGAGFYFMTPFNRVSLVKSILEYV